MVNEQLIVDFVNTAELDEDREDLASPAALLAWLDERGLDPGPRATKADLAEALRVREALRDLMAAHNDVAVDRGAAASVLDDAVCRAKLQLRFEPDGPHLRPEAGGVRGALGRILAEVSAAMAEGVWDRFKACRADDCRWAFFDAAKNKSRAWCSMRSCGNRAKVHAYRERHQ